MVGFFCKDLFNSDQNWMQSLKLLDFQHWHSLSFNKLGNWASLQVSFIDLLLKFGLIAPSNTKWFKYYKTVKNIILQHTTLYSIIEKHCKRHPSSFRVCIQCILILHENLSTIRCLLLNSSTAIFPVENVISAQQLSPLGRELRWL